MKSIERLFKYLEHKRIKHTRAEKEWGLSNGYLNTQLKRNADLGESAIRTIVDNCLDLSPEWLLLGRGDMLTETFVAKKSKDDDSTLPGSEAENIHLSHTPIHTPISKSENLGVQNTKGQPPDKNEGRNEREVELLYQLLEERERIIAAQSKTIELLEEKLAFTARHTVTQTGSVIT